MATRFIEQATAQVAPIYDQQISQAQSQIPSIQKLYDTLIGGLRGESERQLQTGVQGIVEDASGRGVLRSTLPVDARTQLQGAISSALTEGIGNLNLRQIQDVSTINERVGNLRIQRAGGIQSLAEALQAADLREREFAMQQEAARRSAAAASQQSAGINALLSYLQGQTNQLPQNLQGLTLDDIFGAGTAAGIRVQTPTQQTLLQPAGTARLQPTTNPQRAAAPTNYTTQPRLQGGGAISGTLRVR